MANWSVFYKPDHDKLTVYHHVSSVKSVATLKHFTEMILSCLEYFADNKIKNKKKQMYLLFNEGFTRLRYKLDNQDTHGHMHV